MIADTAGKTTASTGAGIHLTAAVAAHLIWSTSFVVTKLAYESIPPLTLGVCRFALALVALAIALAAKREFVKPAPKDLGMLALSGFLGITLYFAMENVGVKLTSASNAALIMAAYPAITLLMERLCFHARIPAMKWFGIAIAVAGVYLVSSVGGDHADGMLTGNLILVATGFVWAFFAFTTRAVVNKYPAVTVSFYQTLAGTVMFVPLAFLERDEWRVPTGQSMGAVVYLGIFCSVAAFMLYNYGLRRLAPSTMVMLANLVPVFGVFFSALVLHESLHLRQLVGGAVVIFGVYLSVRQGRAPPKTEVPHL